MLKSSRKRLAFCGGVVLTAIALPGHALAEEVPSGLEIEGSIRARYEVLDGNFRPGGQDSEEVLLLRSLVEASYSGDGFTIGAQLQDSRAYGNDAASPIGSGDVNALELIELYARLELTDAIDVTLGRQAISLGSKRLLGNPGYRNAANAFTGARIDWEGEDHAKATVFYLLPQQRLPASGADLLDNKVEWDREGTELALWGAFYQRPDIGPFTVEAYVYGLDEDDLDDRPTRNRHLVTPGLRLLARPASGRLDTEIEAAWQTGNIRSSAAANASTLDVSAYFLHAEVGYTFDAPMQPRLSLFSDIASGDHEDTASYNKFDPLFGPRWSDFGPTGLYGPLSYSNIRTLGVRAFAKFTPALDGQLNWRRLWLDSATQAFASTGVRDATGAAGRDAGSQLELKLRWQIVPDKLRFEGGAAWLAQGPFFDLAPNATGFGDTTMAHSALIFEF